MMKLIICKIYVVILPLLILILMLQIYYILLCIFNKFITFAAQSNAMRNILLTDEFLEYYHSLPDKVKEKYDYVMQIIRSQQVVSEKFIKHLENTEFYEARISVGTNEYRTILFTMDSQSFIESTVVLFLNSFLKKSSNQYKSEIKKAESILKHFIED